MKKLFKFILNTIPRPVLIRLSYIARPIISLFLRGKTYIDPIDGKGFSRFLPYGYERKLKNLEYTTTDLNSPLADIKADICDLPFGDNEYDIIFCNHVLEHIPDDTRAMQELFRVLKSGGMAILQIPQDLNRETTFEDNTITDRKERAKIFGQYDHVRVYGRDYFEKLRAIGFNTFGYRSNKALFS